MDKLRNWYESLQERDRRLVWLMSGIITLLLIYLIIWEPLQNNLQQQREKADSQRQLLSWMKEAAAEVRTLQAAGVKSRQNQNPQPITTLAERSAQGAGIRPNIKKLESEGDNGAKVQIEGADFRRLAQWLGNLEQNYGIKIKNLTINRTKESGLVDARLSLESP